MNEYLYEIMNEEAEYDELDQYVLSSRKVARKHRTYIDSQIVLSDTPENWRWTAKYGCESESYKHKYII